MASAKLKAGVVSDAPTLTKPAESLVPKVAVKKAIQTMTPIAPTTAKTFIPTKTVAPTKVETKPVEAFKPKTESTAKKGIDAALDGLE